MGSKAGTVGVMGVHMRSPGSIKGFHINKGIGARTIKVLKHYIRYLAQAGTRALHPVIKASVATMASSLSNHSMGAMDGIKEGDKGLNGRIVAHGVEANAMHAIHEVTVSRLNGGGSLTMGRGMACMASNLLG